jgi:hypothetical protein
MLRWLGIIMLLGMVLCYFLAPDKAAPPADKPALPEIKEPILFNTPEADKILAALQVFPPDNPWNEDISKLPVLPNSKKIIATIGTDLPLKYNLDMGFVLVPPDQKKVPFTIKTYADESDKGPWPIPDNAPIENWPLDKRTLTAAQQGTENEDRHVIVVDPVNRVLYELYRGHRGADGAWDCSNSAKFDLKSNELRHDGWTSADAAGLPIFPAVVRFDECERGEVQHAMRLPSTTPARPTSTRRRTTPAVRPTPTCRVWASASACGPTSISVAIPPMPRRS